MIALLTLGVSAEQLFQPMMRGAAPVGYSSVVSPVAYAPPVQSIPVVSEQAFEQGFELPSVASVGALFGLGVVAAAALIRPKAPALAVQGSTRRAALLSGAALVLPTRALAAAQPKTFERGPNQFEESKKLRSEAANAENAKVLKPTCKAGFCEKAECVITGKGAKGSQGLKGVVKFYQDGDKCQIQYDIQKLSPGPHVLHITDTADFRTGCDGTGKIFKPKGAPAGKGDIGVIVADEKGNAKGFVIDEYISLVSDDNVIGMSMTVNAEADDGSLRLGCGEIVLIKQRKPVEGKPAFESNAERQKRQPGYVEPERVPVPEKERRPNVAFQSFSERQKSRSAD
jgi:Cu/Zn superoxide dismutase